MDGVLRNSVLLTLPTLTWSMLFHPSGREVGVSICTKSSVTPDLVRVNY
jgi:hypothetical protein